MLGIASHHPQRDALVTELAARVRTMAEAVTDQVIYVTKKGEPRPIRDIPWAGMSCVSLQSLGDFNTGWDFSESNVRFRYLNTAHAFTGIILLTFFVGVYTRMILA